jgi:DNA-binding CsgD family transcriptional regulator
MVTEAELREIIGRIYETASGEVSWAGALKGVCDAIGCAGMHMLVARPDGSSVPFSVASGFSSEVEAEYRTHYASICPRLRYTKLHPGFDMFTDYDLMDESAIDRSEFHAWLARANGFRYSICARLPAPPGFTGAIAAQYTRRQGHPQRTHVERTRLLLPHLARAFEVGQRLQTVDLRRQAAEEALERMACGVLVLDRRGRVVFANRVATGILASQDGVGLRDGGLFANDPGADWRLRRLVAGAVTAAGGGGLALPPADSARVPRPSGRLALAVRAAPLPTRALGFEADAPSALLFLHDPETAVRLDPRAVARLYGLSPGEARLAAALASGSTVEGYARAAGLSVNTVRWRLRQIRAKTGCARQADLVRLLTAGATLAAADSPRHPC